ncbi:MAG: radical SAM protein [Candidatus Coatesbacteria bacterium]|nr:radical SAM protein [Candidatus Coatesbacteria bacterium]
MSPVWESIKSTGAHIAARNISRKLARDPKGTFIKLAELFEKVSVHDVDRERARDMRWLFKNEHVFLDFMERSVTQLAEKPRRALIENFFMNPFVFEERKKQWQEENGFKPLELLVLSITARCNLHCYGCWAAKYSKKSDDLDYEVLDRLIGEAHNQMGVTLFVLTGGEPFMRKEEMYRLLEKYDKCFFIIYTNSLLITDEDADRLAELGNGAPMISIEGDKATTDARRSNGYDKIISRMELLRDKGVLFGFSGTVTEKNAEYFGSDEFIKLMIDKGCMFGWLFHYIPIGAEPELELILSPEKRDKLRHDVYRMRNKYPIFLADFWNDGYIAHGCLAGGRQYLHVNNNGDIEPCVFAHFAVDNAYETTLTQALQHDFMKAIRGEIPYDGNLLRPCMIIDHPEMLRRHVAEHQARPTHTGAETILERADIIDKLDTNAARWREITEEAVLKGDYMIMYPTRLKPRVPGSSIALPVTPDEIPEGEAARYAAGLEWAFYHPDSEREDHGVLEESTKLTTDSSDEELSESESLH